jgi:hypothetical protein
VVSEQVRTMGRMDNLTRTTWSMTGGCHLQMEVGI